MTPLRKHSRPPYEVMKRPMGGPRPMSPMPAAPRPTESKPEPAMTGGLQAGDLWDRMKTPVVLRLPQGYLALLVLACVALMVLAYLVGHTRGERDARTSNTLTTTQQQAGLGGPAMVLDLPPAMQNQSQPVLTGQQQQIPTMVTPATAADPRQAGLNYFILIHYPPDEAQRLVEFLRSQGVSAVAVKTNRPNHVQVVALQGFPRDQLNSPQRRDYEQMLRRVGRAWKAHNNNKGDDLSSMYPALYNAS